MNISSSRNYVEVTVECIDNDRLNEARKRGMCINQHSGNCLGNQDVIININNNYGDCVEFDSVEEMEHAISYSGYTIPEDGLKEGVDYEIKQGDQGND